MRPIYSGLLLSMLAALSNVSPGAEDFETVEHLGLDPSISSGFRIAEQACALQEAPSLVSRLSPHVRLG